MFMTTNLQMVVKLKVNEEETIRPIGAASEILGL